MCQKTEKKIYGIILSGIFQIEFQKIKKQLM